LQGSFARHLLEELNRSIVYGLALIWISLNQSFTNALFFELCIESVKQLIVKKHIMLTIGASNKYTKT